jgi:hypothetical protein
VVEVRYTFCVVLEVRNTFCVVLEVRYTFCVVLEVRYTFYVVVEVRKKKVLKAINFVNPKFRVKFSLNRNALGEKMINTF